MIVPNRIFPAVKLVRSKDALLTVRELELPPTTLDSLCFGVPHASELVPTTVATIPVALLGASIVPPKLPETVAACAKPAMHTKNAPERAIHFIMINPQTRKKTQS